MKMLISKTCGWLGFLCLLILGAYAGRYPGVLFAENWDKIIGWSCIVIAITTLIKGIIYAPPKEKE
jgi:hypothetical protein